MVQRGLDDSLAEDVVEVEKVVVNLLSGERGRSRIFRQEGLRRLVVGVRRRYGDELSLGPPERGEPASENAARVDADRVVQPFGFGDRRVPVHDGGRPSVLLRPGVAHRQPVLVRLAGRFTEERELANHTRAASLERLL